MTSTEPTPQELSDLLNLLSSMDEHKRYNKMLYFKAYPKQQEFFRLGATKRERMFMAGNRVGKSEGGAFEAACHATGDYPADWEGAKFDHPTKGWVAGTTSLDVRNVAQTKLCGQYGVTAAFGTGFIPKDRFADKPTLARGVTDAFDTVQVIHRTNGVEDGVSTIAFKSYEQGRAKFQGDDLDWGWGDEEPDKMEVYSEFLTRINGPGRMFVTFTPLLGETELVVRYTKEDSADRAVVHMSLDEAMHFTEEEKEKRLAGYASYERDARRYGTPLLGSGRVFPYDENLFKEPMITDIPIHWRVLWGLDFGIGHPFGAVLLLHDADSDCVHVHACVRMADMQPLNHAMAMKSIAGNAPAAWPHDGHIRQQGSDIGAPLASIYRQYGVKMLGTHATFSTGGNSTEAGVTDMDQRMTTGRLKVGAQCSQWFEEYRFYHRKDGLIVKIRDDLLSATRIGLMMLRYARPVPLGPASAARRGPGTASDIDFDLF